MLLTYELGTRSILVGTRVQLCDLFCCTNIHGIQVYTLHSQLAVQQIWFGGMCIVMVLRKGTLLCLHEWWRIIESVMWLTELMHCHVFV